MDYSKELARYHEWCEQVWEEDLQSELKQMEGNSAKIIDAFYRDLEFGTGGLRGIIGVGTNRMNIYTVAKASQGLSNYILQTANNSPMIAIGYDSRIKSEVFARVAAEVFAANGIQVRIYDTLMPTPCVSFAIRMLKCTAGIVVTASHNPAQYNGYKVYGADGCQITTNVAQEILDAINRINIFHDIRRIGFQEGMQSGKISYIEPLIYTEFINAVKKQSVLGTEKVNKNISIVYTPLHGTGLKPVLRVLEESGFNNVQVVKEQEQPDGRFSTCPYPNPEIEEAMALGIETAKKLNAELLLATDPDCDRVGIAVRNEQGLYCLLSGNEVGVLLFDYICSRRIKNNSMPARPVLVKTIVTTDMAEKIAKHYGVKTINVLTGFKYIGEIIGQLEKQGDVNSYIFGFEESCGYLSGTYVRDKDAVNGALLICEMFAYYKAQGKSLLQHLKELYEIYGVTQNYLHSYEFKGVNGLHNMKQIMKRFRSNLSHVGAKKVEICQDYLCGVDGLPEADVIKFYLEDDSTLVVRPSGTEPKIKVYTCIHASTCKEAKLKEKNIIDAVEKILQI